MPRIMIVDDVTSIRQIVSKVFQDVGYQVTEAAAGEEALELAQDPVARGDDRVGELLVHRAQLTIGQRGRALEQDEGADEERMLAKPADGIVLDGALRLRPVQGISRDADFADGVAFDSSFH